MKTVRENILNNTTGIVEYFKSKRILLDYSIDSFRSIDIFIDQQKSSKESPESSSNFSESMLFSLGAYIGETIVRNVANSSWVIDDDSQHENKNPIIKLSNGRLIDPVEQVINRFNHGATYELYAFGATIHNEVSKETYWSKLNNDLQWRSDKSGKRKLGFG